jgi:light-regulated signal transduction histidine kinase (bacteriophytochrome)
MMLNSGLIPIHNGFDELFKILSVMHYVILPQGRVVVGVLRSAKTTTYSNRCLGYRTGINEEQRIKLFQEFERCGHTSPWGEQGLGLGLAIVQRMTSLLDFLCMFILSW